MCIYIPSKIIKNLLRLILEKVMFVWDLRVDVCLFFLGVYPYFGVFIWDICLPHETFWMNLGVGNWKHME